MLSEHRNITKELTKVALSLQSALCTDYANKGERSSPLFERYFPPILQRFIVIDELLVTNHVSEALALSRSILEAMPNISFISKNTELSEILFERAVLHSVMKLHKTFLMADPDGSEFKTEEINSCLNVNKGKLLELGHKFSSAFVGDDSVKNAAEFDSDSIVKKIDGCQKSAKMLGKSFYDLYKEHLEQDLKEGGNEDKVKTECAVRKKMYQVLSSYVHLSNPFIYDFVKISEEWLREDVNDWMSWIMGFIADRVLRDDKLKERIFLISDKRKILLANNE